MTIESASPSASSRAAVALVGTLIAIYIVSQFLRNSVGVIAPDLAAELDLSPAEIGLLSSVFFFAFAAVQIPLGMALDRFGPRRCLIACVAITVAGILVFASATSTLGLIAGRAFARARRGELPGRAAGDLRQAVSARAVRDPDRPAGRLRHHRHADRDRAACVLASVAIGWRGSFLAVGAFTCPRRAVARRRGQGRGANAARTAANAAREPRRHPRGYSHAFGRAALCHEPRGLFVICPHGRPLGRALSHAYLRLRPGSARRFSAHPGAGADPGLAGLGRDRPPLRQLQAARAAGIGADRDRACHLALVGTLPPAGLVAWFTAFGLHRAPTAWCSSRTAGAVSAPSGRTRPHRPSISGRWAGRSWPRQ